MSTLTLNSIFGRIDRNHDSQLDRGEVHDFVEAAGVGAGENFISRGLKLELATNEAMTRLGGTGGNVSYSAFTHAIQGQMTSLGCGSGASCGPADLLAYFDVTDTNQDQKLSQAELLPGILTGLKAQNVPMPDSVAPEVTKVMMRLLDESGNGAFDRAEAQSLAGELGKLS